MYAPRFVSDEVWAQLDPRAGRLARREHRLVFALVAGLVLTLGLAIAAAATGVVDPRLDTLVAGADVDRADHRIEAQVEIDNRSSVAAHVEVVADPSVPDVSVNATPLRVPAHSARTVTILVRVRDCSTVTRDSRLDPRLTVHHWWGDRTRDLFGDDGFSGSELLQQACRGH